MLLRPRLAHAQKEPLLSTLLTQREEYEHHSDLFRGLCFDVYFLNVATAQNYGQASIARTLCRVEDRSCVCTPHPEVQTPTDLGSRASPL